MILDDELTMITDGVKEPSWTWISAAYIRSFSRCRRVPTDDTMPGDKRLIEAVRAVYRASGAADRAVMANTFSGSREERKHRFFRLSILVALQAGLTAWAAVPPSWEQMTDPAGPGESEEDY